MRTDIDLDIKQKTFASGLLPELIAILRQSRPGDLVGVVADEASVGPELETWCRFTGNTLLESTIEEGRARWVFRCGAIPAEDNRLKEFIYHRAGAGWPKVFTATWAGHEKAGPLLFATEHVGSTDDGKNAEVLFTDVAVKVTGSDNWINAQ